MNDQARLELAERVRELEASLEALREGKLDAVVGVGESDGVLAVPTKERPFRLMVEQMSEGAVTLDPESGAVLYCNVAFVMMLGLPPDSVLGRDFTDFLPEEEQGIVAELIAAPRGFRGETRLLRVTEEGDDQIVRQAPVALAANTIESPDGDTVCVIVSDLRERRIAERLRRKQAELEIESQRKDDFIAMLGHELRNPLASIQHAVDLLQGPELEARVIGKIHQTLLRQTQHVKRLVDDLLDTTRMTQGTLRMARRPMDLRNAAEAALETLRATLHDKPRALKLRLPKEPVRVSGDAARLTQVLTNLLGNAIKFTATDDAIDVELSVVGAHAKIVVADAGRGIDPEMLPKIYQAFVQEDVVFDRAVGGLGLGLALVKRIVEHHDGTVEAHSEGRGHGATFTVMLPRLREEAEDGTSAVESRPADAAPQPKSGAEDDPRGPRRVVICDDNQDAAEMLGLLLEARGHDVRMVVTGEEALEEIGRETPDVLLLDIGLPGIDGYTVARRLRADASTQGLRIVALTGYGQSEDRDAALEAGCDLHLTKPVSKAQLEDALGST